MTTRSEDNKPQRLWCVEVVQTVYVLAETREAAERAAPRYARDEKSNPDAIAYEAKSLRQVERDRRDSIPYGGDGSATIEAWLARREAAK